MLTALLPMGFGDDWLRFNGIGENVTWDMYNNDTPSQEQKEHYSGRSAGRPSAASRPTQHWSNNRSFASSARCLERVNREMPIAPLRWSIAHIHDASLENLARIKSLGVGWLMQNAILFPWQAFLGQRGADGDPARAGDRRARSGWDSGRRRDRRARVMSYNPFVSLQWMLDGRTSAASRPAAPRKRRRASGAAHLYPGQRLVLL